MNLELNNRAGKTVGLIMLMLMFFVFLLTGCSDRSQQGLPGGSAPAVIEVWHSLSGPEADALLKQSKRIESERPEILLRLKYIPEDRIVNLVYLAQAGGEGPEIFMSSGEVLQKLYQQGALSPLLSKAEAFPGLTAVFRHNEQDFVQPLAADIPVFYYRTDLAQPPSALYDLAGSKGNLMIPSLGMPYLSAWWSGQGGKLLNNGYANLDSPENQVFLQQLLGWRDSKRMTVGQDAWNEYVNGRTAYTIAWAGQAKALEQTLPWGTMDLIQLTGGRGKILPGRIFGLANASVKKSESLDTMIKIVEEELAKPDAQFALSQAGNRFPANPAFYQRQEAQTKLLQQVNSGLSNAWVLSSSSVERKLIPVQEQAWQKTWNGTVATMDALAQAQIEAIRILSENN